MLDTTARLSLVSSEFISGMDVLNLVAIAFAPTLPILLGWIWKMIVGMRGRISELEEQSTRHSRTLYGDADDPTHSGLAEELSEIKDTLGDVEREITYISRALDSDRLQGRRDENEKEPDADEDRFDRIED